MYLLYCMTVALESKADVSLVLHDCSLGGLAKTHGVQIKASGATLRQRLFQALEMLPPTAYEGMYIVEGGI